MAFGVIVFGVLMGLGGAAVMARGAPYYMLEWGLAYLAAGAVAVSTGLLLVVMGLILRRLLVIERQVAALSRASEIPVAPPVSPSISPSLAPAVSVGPVYASGPSLAAHTALGRMEPPLETASSETTSQAADPHASQQGTGALADGSAEGPDPLRPEPGHGEAARQAGAFSSFAEPRLATLPRSPGDTDGVWTAPAVALTVTDAATRGSNPNLAGVARDILSSVSVQEVVAPAPAVTAHNDVDRREGVVPAPSEATIGDGPVDPFERINRALRDLRQGALGESEPPQPEFPGRIDPRTEDLAFGQGDSEETDASDRASGEAGPRDVASDQDGETASASTPAVPDDQSAAHLDDLRGELLEAAAQPARLSEESSGLAEPDAPVAAQPAPVPTAERAGKRQPPPGRSLREPSIEATDDRVYLIDVGKPGPPHAADMAPTDPTATQWRADHDAAAADAGETRAAETNAGPAASADGIIAAYTVGDSAFTMYADGRIEAATPEGRYSFASMEELRTFMAERRRP